MQRLLTSKKTLIVIFSLIFISCTTQKKQHSYIDYSDESVVLYQIESAKELLSEKKSLRALLYSLILESNTENNSKVLELKENALTKVKDDFYKDVSKKNWSAALRKIRSLKAIGEYPKDWTEDKILKEQSLMWKKQEHSPLLAKHEGTTNPVQTKNFEEMLKGTVTVWVDKGTRIESGLGFSDIVIGSGFFIDKRGYFITNYHVIQSEVDKNYNGYSRVYIKAPNNPDVKIKAKVIGWDPLFDLALVKTELTPEVIFKLGSSEKLKIGSKIFAIGSPAGLEKTLTSGIISTKYRRLFSIVDVMQIDAPINHGNSGGPIVDEKGNVQGIAFAGLEENEGLNFAIPVELLQNILPQLYAGGKTEHSWLGGYGRKKEIPNGEQGIEASYIMPESPLAISQVKEGSIITEFNGVKVSTVKELQKEMLSIMPETIIKVRGYEKNKNNEFIPKEWPVLCTKRPLLPSDEILKKDLDFRSMLPIFGFHLEPTGKRKTYRVKKVVPGSFADEAGFSENDTIEINGKNKIENNKNVIQFHIYAKKIKTGYIDSFMIISQYLDNSNFF